jgi:NADPH:quinone reductase-like Zn-dependent oxidoreductase
VEANGKELAEILGLVVSGKVKPHVQKTYPLEEAAQAMSAVEKGHSVGKVVLTVG